MFGFFLVIIYCLVSFISLGFCNSHAFKPKLHMYMQVQLYLHLFLKVPCSYGEAFRFLAIFRSLLCNCLYITSSLMLRIWSLNCMCLSRQIFTLGHRNRFGTECACTPRNEGQFWISWRAECLNILFNTMVLLMRLTTCRRFSYLPQG